MSGIHPNSVATEDPMVRSIINGTEESGYPAVVKKIHKEFLTSGDRLLAESKTMLANIGKADERQKATRLARIGFENVPEVEKENRIQRQVSEIKKKAETVEFYHNKYPYKFVTEDIVLRICEKYKLIFGSISEFKGFVPEYNLKEIETFSASNIQTDKMSFVRIKSVEFSDSSTSECDRIVRSYLKERSGRILSKSRYSDDIINFLQRISEVETKDGLRNSRIRNISHEVIGSSNFLICAPKKDMDIKEGFTVKFSVFKPAPVLDPVVLAPVNGGFLVVTAWGDEANDPMIVNPKSN